MPKNWAIKQKLLKINIMKRLVIIFFLSIVFYTTNAQVHFTSNGNVGIKTTSTSEELTVD